MRFPSGALRARRDRGDGASGRFGVSGPDEPETTSPHRAGPPAKTEPTTTVGSGELKNEIPSSELDGRDGGALRAWGTWSVRVPRGGRGVPRGARASPGWIPGSINLAIALLNDSGVKAEEAKKAGGEAAARQFERRSICSRRAGPRPGQSARPLLPGHHPRAAGQPCRGPQPFQAGDRDRPQRRGGLVLAGRTLPEPERRTATGPRRSRRSRSNRSSLQQGPRAQSVSDSGRLQAMRLRARFVEQRERAETNCSTACSRSIPNSPIGPVARPGRRPRQEVR